MKGEALLIVEYEFTNNTDKAGSFVGFFMDKAFQNGVECETSILSPKISFNDLFADVKPDSTFRCTNGYLLRDNKSAVEIEVKQFLHDEMLAHQVIEIT
jgi:dTDP-4-dehydrorhamnose 3,5-epimerase-like enzyme